MEILGADGNDFVSLSNLGDFSGEVQIDAGPGLNQFVANDQGGNGGIVNVYQNRIEGLFANTIYYASTGGSFQNIDGSVGGVLIQGSDSLEVLMSSHSLQTIH